MEAGNAWVREHLYVDCVGRFSLTLKSFTLFRVYHAAYPTFQSAVQSCVLPACQKPGQQRARQPSQSRSAQSGIPYGSHARPCTFSILSDKNKSLHRNLQRETTLRAQLRTTVDCLYLLVMYVLEMITAAIMIPTREPGKCSAKHKECTDSHGDAAPPHTPGHLTSIPLRLLPVLLRGLSLQATQAQRTGEFTYRLIYAADAITNRFLSLRMLLRRPRGCVRLQLQLQLWWAV